MIQQSSPNAYFSRRQQWTLVLILVVYFLLGLVYLWATPPLESSDEYKHYPVVQHIQTNSELPVLYPDAPGLWLQEGAQPPLYYLLMAGLTSSIDTSDLRTVHQKNPHAFIGNPAQIGNKNLIIHDPEQETWPWTGTVLAVYLIRIASLVLGLGTLGITAVIGKRLFSPTTTLLAVALTAFNPMFLFISAAVNNDSLAVLLSHLALLLLLIISQDKTDPGKKWWLYSALGLILGVGILTKLSMGGLLGLSGLGLAWLAWRERHWQYIFIGGPLVLIPALLVSGWWFLRNMTLYGDLTGLNAFIAVQGTRDVPIDLAGWLDEWGTFYRTFWGLFGGVNIAAPQIFYLTANILAVIGIIGFIKWLRPSTKERLIHSGVWLLLAWAGILFVLLIRWNLISPAFQGRLIFPALGAIMLLLAQGLLVWFNAVWQKRVAIGLVLGWAITAVLIPLFVIQPVYAQPAPLTAVPAARQIDPIRYNDQIALVGVAMAEGQSATPEDGFIAVTLYWQAIDNITQDYLSSVHVLGRNYNSEGQVDRYPASGLIPTSRWQPGEIYEDTYHVYLQDTAVAPTQLQVAVSLLDTTTGDILLAQSADGVPIDPVLVGELASLHDPNAQPPNPQHQLGIDFDEGITLLGYEFGEDTAVSGQTIPLTLYWQANATPSQDYTVFVQLLGNNRELIASADAPPVNNFFPTSLWQNGDWIDDTHHLTIPANLPPGQYPILIGLYDPISGLRLARQDGAGDFVEISLTIREE